MRRRELLPPPLMAPTPSKVRPGDFPSTVIEVVATAARARVGVMPVTSARHCETTARAAIHRRLSRIRTACMCVPVCIRIVLPEGGVSGRRTVCGWQTAWWREGVAGQERQELGVNRIRGLMAETPVRVTDRFRMS